MDAADKIESFYELSTEHGDQREVDVALSNSLLRKKTKETQKKSSTSPEELPNQVGDYN